MKQMYDSKTEELTNQNFLTKGLTSEDTVKCSQGLDFPLNYGNTIFKKNGFSCCRIFSIKQPKVLLNRKFQKIKTI
jgi:hypothetical protein